MYSVDSLVILHNLCRYRSNSSMATEFAVDDSNVTSWRSRNGETPAAFTVGLNLSIVLSKILVNFQAPPSYQKAVLQFSSRNVSEWEDLQYYAMDCTASFGVNLNEE